MEIESCSLLLQALPLGGCGQGELVGVEKWQDPLPQAQLEVPQPKGCPEGGSGDPKPSGVGRGTLGWHPPLHAVCSSRLEEDWWDLGWRLRFAQNLSVASL